LLDINLNLVDKNMIVFAAIMPHPPESIPGIGKGKDLKPSKKHLILLSSLDLGLNKLILKRL